MIVEGVGFVDSTVLNIESGLFLLTIHVRVGNVFMIITKERAIKILSGDPDEKRPTLLRIFKRNPSEPWTFWADYGEHFDEIPKVQGLDPNQPIKVLATWGFNTVNGNALLETYRHNHQKE